MNKMYFKGAVLSLLLASSSSFAQTKQDIEMIKRETNVTALEQLGKELMAKTAKEKAEAVKYAKANGLEIRGTDKRGSLFELMKLTEDKIPVYYSAYNANAAESTRATTLHSGGHLGLDLNGEDMTVYVWDGGHAKIGHTEYKKNNMSWSGTRVSIMDGNTVENDHANHVTGTIIARGADAGAKGMAPKAIGKSYEWNSDAPEATAAAGNGMILSNHSYGFKSSAIPDQWFGAYIDEAQVWDKMMYNAPYYLMVVAAGNDGDMDFFNSNPLEGNSAYDKLSGHSVSKNNIVVANMRDANINGQGDLVNVSRTSSSSEGPSDDYRIKPDLSGNGELVYSCGILSNHDYAQMTGTSMASPNVTGTLLLLQQHYKAINNNFMKAATLKGLALHTADDILDNGPDAKSGWGLMNAKFAAQTISKNGNQSSIREETLNNGSATSFTVQANGNETLKVSISWTDRAGQIQNGTNSSTPVLVNDLDLRVKKNEEEFFPWKLTGVTSNGKGDNNVDPFERVDVANANGTYEVIVSHKGNIGNGQNYSIVVTGGKIDGNGNGIAPPPVNNPDPAPAPPGNNPWPGNPAPAPAPAPPGNGCNGLDVKIRIKTGTFPQDISWTIKNSSGATVVRGRNYTQNTVFEGENCMEFGCYTFNIKDQFNDGFSGGGNIKVSINGQDKVFVQGNFGSSKTQQFCVGNNEPAPAPAPVPVPAPAPPGNNPWPGNPWPGNPWPGNPWPGNPIPAPAPAPAPIPAPAPPPACAMTNVYIETGFSGNRLKWKITNTSTGAIVGSGDGYNKHETKEIAACLPLGCYTVEVEQLRWKSKFRLTVNGNIITEELGNIMGKNFTKQFCLQGGQSVPTTLGENSIVEKFDLKVYPNPANGGDVTIETGSKSNVAYQVYNAQGVLVTGGKCIDGYTKFDTNNMKPGLYIINVKDNKGNIVSKKLLVK